MHVCFQCRAFSSGLAWLPLLVLFPPAPHEREHGLPLNLCPAKSSARHGGRPRHLMGGQLEERRCPLPKSARLTRRASRLGCAGKGDLGAIGFDVGTEEQSACGSVWTT